MPIINATIRWADNTAELRQRLKEGIGTIEAMKSAVDKTVQSLGGQGLFQAANKVTAALIEMGGAQKLTASEQARVNDLLTKAIEKYKLMGQVAPPAMVQLAQDTKKAEVATSGFSVSIESLGKTFLATMGGFLSAQAILGTVKTSFSALISEFEKLTVEGAAVADVADNFKRLTDQAGLLGDALLTTLRQGTHATINDFELMKTVNQDLAAGMKLTDAQFAALSKGAFALAQATGTDVKSALDTMNDAMLTGRTRALALLTGKIDLEKAEKAYAASLGSTREHLTEEGKLEAARVAILDAVSAATARLGEQTDGLDEIVQQAKVAWENFEHALGQAVATSDVLMAGLETLRDGLRQAFGGTQQEVIRNLSHVIDDVAISLIDFAQAGVTSAGFVAKEFIALYKVFAGLTNAIDQQILGFKRLSLVAAIAIRDFEGVQRIRGEIDALTESIKARDAAIEQATKLQDAAGKGAQSFNTILADMRTKMVAARDAHVDFQGPLEETVRTTKAATAATVDRSRVLQQTTAELKAAEKAEADRAKALEQARAAELAMGRQALMTQESLKGLSMSGGLIADSFELAKQKMDGFTASAEKAVKYDLSSFFDMGRIAPPSMKDLDNIKKSFVEQFKDIGRTAMGSLNDIFQRAFEGGGALKGALTSLGIQVTKGLLSLIPGVGQFLSQFAGAIVAGFKKLWGKLTGGPSEAELGARGEQADLIQMFRDAGHAGSDFEVIMSGVQEAVADVGGSAEDARRLVEGLLDTKHPERYKQAVQELNKVLDEGKKRWEAVGDAIKALNAFSAEGIDTQGKFNTAAATAIALFDDWVRKTGDVLGAIEQLSPTLDALKDAQMNLGLAGSEAIDKLLKIRDVAEANQPLIDNIKQSTLLIEALGRTGDLTGDLLIKFGQNAVNQFTLLKQATGDETVALSLMAPELQKLWEHQQKFHDITDQSTLALLDLAETQGVVGEDMKDVNEQILDVLKLIAEALGADLPRAARDGARGVNRELDTIHDRDVTVRTHHVNEYETESTPEPIRREDTAPTATAPSPPISPTPIGTAVPRIRGASTGGYVTPLGIQPLHMATGGLVPPKPPQYLQAGNLANAPTMFPSRGTDTVHAMLTPGELVLNENQQRGELVQPVVNAIEKLRADVKILQQLTGVKGDTVVEVDGRELVRAANRVWDNGGTVRTASREALGIES